MEIKFLGYHPCSSPFLIKPSPDTVACARDLASVNLSSFMFYSNLGVRLTFPQQTFWLSTPIALYMSSFLRAASLAPVPRQGSYGSPALLRPPLKRQLKEPFITYASDDFLYFLYLFIESFQYLVSHWMLFVFLFFLFKYSWYRILYWLYWSLHNMVIWHFCTLQVRSPH